MCILSYYKFGKIWYLHLPDYLEQERTRPEDLERIGSFADFLDLAAQGEDSVRLQFSTESFEGADLLQLTGTSGERSGGYYRLLEFNNRRIDMELWFNRVIYHFKEELPECLYINLIAS